MKQIIINTGKAVSHKTSDKNERSKEDAAEIKSIYAARRKSSQGQSKRKPKKQRKKNRLFFFVSTIIILVAAIILPLTMFFNIEGFEVKGNSRYTSEELISASGISQGENLFRIRKLTVEESILQKYPYVESVNIKRVLPSTLLIDVIEATPAYCLVYLGNEMVISSKGKVLEIAKDRSKFAIPELKEVEAQDCTVGGQVVFVNEVQQSVLNELIAALENQSLLNEVDWLDTSELYMIKVGYDNRINILLGNSSDLVYKLQFSKYIITTISNSDTGVVDVSDTKRASFRPGK